MSLTSYVIPPMARRLTNRVHRPGFLVPSARARQERMAKVRAKWNPAINAMYSCPQWRALRAQVLRDTNYVCASWRCSRRACIVDHKTPHRGDAGLFFDRSNLQPLCKHHHDIKTARRDGGFGNRRGQTTQAQPNNAELTARQTGQPGPQFEGGESRFSGAQYQ